MIKSMPPHVRRELARLLAQEVRAAAARADNPEGMPHAIDREDFSRTMQGLTAMHAVLGLLEGVPKLGEIGQTIEEIEEEYGTGGPPISPVHDSFFMMWSMVDLTFGRQSETVASIVLALAPLVGLSEELRRSMACLAASRLGVYRVQGQGPALRGASALYRVREVVTGRELSLQFVEDYDIHPLDLLLLRPLELPEASAKARGVSHLVVASPYVLQGHSDPEWVDYFEREAAELGVRLDTAVYERIMRGAGDPRRWLEYIFVGYAGTREKNIVLVDGIPDRPETLPEHEDFDPADAEVIPPGSSPRERALILSKRIVRRCADMLDARPQTWLDALGDKFRALQNAGGDPQEWYSTMMAAAYYEGELAGEPTIGAQLLGDELDDDEREFLESALAGFTSIFEVVAVRSGESMRLRDLLNGGEYDVVERAASTNTPTGIVLFARLQEYRGVWLLDALFLRPASLELAERILKQARERLRHEHLEGRSMGAAVYDVMAAWQHQQAFRPDLRPTTRPTLVTSTGEPVAFCTATYAFDAAARPRVLTAVARLRGCEPSAAPPDDSRTEHYIVLTADDVVEARIEVGPTTLTIEAHAQARLERVCKRLTSKLAGVLTLVSKDVVSADDAIGGARGSPRR